MPFRAEEHTRLARLLHGFTIIELLITLAAVSVLLALLLPAIQAARESSRRTQCQVNLKQIALALLTYHAVHGQFPPGGWGHEWVGVPERGTGAGQPGGWAYQILPHLEELELHNLGTGMKGTAAELLYSERLKTPLPLHVCPSRRPCGLWPVVDRYPWVFTPKPFGKVLAVARSDYAINAGISHVFSFRGPADLKQGDELAFWQNAPEPRGFSGISHLRTAAALRSVVDGVSKTYLIGEKYIDSESYATGTSLGDNESLYAGYCTDLHRFAGVIENLKVAEIPFLPPLNDTMVPDTGMPGYIRFGSAHHFGLNMALCDGSVRSISFCVEPSVHFRTGHRADGDSELYLLEK